MLHKTTAIGLNYIRYRETSIIFKAYTEQFGLQSYIVNGVRSAKAHPRMAYYQPLALLSLVVYHRDGADLNRISQVGLADPSLLPSADIRKTTIRIFLSEVMHRVLKEEEPNPDLFRFMFHSLEIFERMEHGFENFHIQFLLRLAGFLGFGAKDTAEIFNQVYGAGNTQGSAYGLARQQEQETLQALLELDYVDHLPMPAILRRDLLELVVKYYQAHVPEFTGVRSLEVLQEVMS